MTPSCASVANTRSARRGAAPWPSDGNAPIGRWPAGFLLNGVESGDPFQRLGDDRRALDGMDVEELATHMRQTGNLADRPGAGQRPEAGIAVGVHSAGEAGQVRLRTRRLAVGREAVPSRQRRLSVPGPLVPHIGPDSARRCLAGPRRQQLDRGCRRRPSATIRAPIPSPYPTSHRPPTDAWAKFIMPSSSNRKSWR